MRIRGADVAGAIGEDDHVVAEAAEEHGMLGEIVGAVGYGRAGDERGEHSEAQVRHPPPADGGEA